MKGRKRVVLIVVSVQLGSWLMFDVGKKVPTTAAHIASALGWRSRSVHDARSGMRLTRWIASFSSNVKTHRHAWCNVGRQA